MGADVIISNVFRREAQLTREVPFGQVGEVFSGEGLEVCWVAKQAEEIDPDWFVQKTVDVIVVLQGHLKVEFDYPTAAERVLDPGDVFVLPAETRCRAYRWPREAPDATLFLAVYPSS